MSVMRRVLTAAFFASTLSVTHALSTPARGWNSYDAFYRNVNESTFVSQVTSFSSLLAPYGYDTLTVDYYWYTTDDFSRTYVDEYGRPQPDPLKWPSSADGSGFSKIADLVHKKGLLFGIHIMRGISGAALAANNPIAPNSPYRAMDIVELPLSSSKCGWSFDQAPFYTVNMSHPGGQIFFNQLVKQYAQWGVDFIKNDCVFGADYVPTQISGMSHAISTSSNPSIVYSLSPGTSTTLSLSQSIADLVDLFRASHDVWDQWDHVVDHFDVAAQLLPLLTEIEVPNKGLHGRGSFADLDMLPIGYIGTPGSAVPTHASNLNDEEQQTMITLWSLFRSPFIMGGDLTRSESLSAIAKITNADVLAIQAHSTNNTYVNTSITSSTTIVWRADLVASAVGTSYVAIFNLANTMLKGVGVEMSAVSVHGSSCDVTEVWSQQHLGQMTSVLKVSQIAAHGVALLKLTTCKVVEEDQVDVE